eukprot:gb/GECG01001544.1/.p1 GENE.gb/GECG01001544.1/~~gb/GECG01001544.1/.p1  ORF type:complete len:374 (+),score=21.37 gb/GECG01001544.1/:1-1122(+)
MVEHTADPPPQEVRDGQIVVATAGCLCMVGALVIIVSFYATSWGSWRVQPETVSRREKVKALAQGYLLQLFWLSVSNFFGGLFFTLSLGIPRDFTIDTICTVQVIGRSFFPMSTAMWNLILAIELHRFIFKHESDLSGKFSRTRYVWYHVVAWSVAVACVTAQYSTMGRVNEGIWCWVNAPGSFHAIPQMAIWFIIFLLNGHIVINIRNNFLAKKSVESASHARKFIFTLMAYSTTFIVVWIAMLIHEMGVGFVKDGTIYGTETIRYFAAATAPIQGFLNAIVFVSTNSRAREWLFCLTNSRRPSMEEEALGSYRELSAESYAQSSETFMPSMEALHSDPLEINHRYERSLKVKDIDEFYHRTSDASTDSTFA